MILREMQKYESKAFSKLFKSINRLPHFKLKNSVFCPCYSVFSIKQEKAVFSIEHEKTVFFSQITRRVLFKPYLVLNMENLYLELNTESPCFFCGFRILSWRTIRI